MRVESHVLFDRFQAALAREPEASIVDSLAESPHLGDFLHQLDPGMSLDWSGRSFQGLPELRENILRRSGCSGACDAEDILVTAGTAEANFLAIAQQVEAGDELIVDVPGWPQPQVLAEGIGASLKQLPRDESRGWAVDVEQLRELVTARTRMIFICNPNNPTGHLMGKAELLEVIAIADRVGAYVLTDEVYRGLEWGEESTPSAAALYERGISTGSVSKVLGLQGLRTGWLICRDRAVIRDAVVLREDTSEIMNVMGEAIASIALSDDWYGPAIARAREAGRRNLDRLEDFIRDCALLSWQRPAAGLIGFARLHSTLDADAFSERLLGAPYRTFVMPGSAYDHPGHLRLGGGGGTAGLDQGLERLGKFVHDHPGIGLP